MISRMAKSQRLVQTSRSSLSMVATTNRPNKESLDSQVEKRNLMEQISAAGLASAAVVAAAAVNSAVGKFTAAAATTAAEASPAADICSIKFLFST